MLLHHVQYVCISSLCRFLKRRASSFAAARPGRIVPSQEVVKMMYDHVARYITWTRIESNLYARCTVRRETLRRDRRCPPAWYSTCVLLLGVEGEREERADGGTNAHLQQLAHRNSKIITSHSWIFLTDVLYTYHMNLDRNVVTLVMSVL